MKRLVKILKWTGIVLLIIFVFIFTFVQLSWDKAHDVPLQELSASTDSALIARGKYLAYGPAHCGTCHVPMEKIMDVENGELIPLSGGWTLSIPPGVFRAPNLTPDMETGIGKLTDAEIVRTLRHSINSKGRAMIGFMPFQEMSDEDLIAILSYLRSQPAMKNDMKLTEFSFLGKALMAFGLIKPEGPSETPPKSIMADTMASYGKYLAHSVANCYGCHTNRDLKTGVFIGEPFAGGMMFPPDEFSAGKTFITPNLTPDPETGWIRDWNEATFINRFLNMKRIHEGTPMPWGAFSRITENDLKAIYRYLLTVPPINNKVDKVVYAKGETPPSS